MKKPRHTVSDHALLRYMERVLHLDVEAVRRDLGHRLDKVTDGVEGASAVYVDGMRFALGENDRVATVWKRHQPLRRVRRPRRGEVEE